jgi:hypothetical protein
MSPREWKILEILTLARQRNGLGAAILQRGNFNQYRRRGKIPPSQNSTTAKDLTASWSADCQARRQRVRKALLCHNSADYLRKDQEEHMSGLDAKSWDRRNAPV